MLLPSVGLQTWRRSRRRRPTPSLSRHWATRRSCRNAIRARTRWSRLYAYLATDRRPVRAAPHGRGVGSPRLAHGNRPDGSFWDHRSAEARGLTISRNQLYATPYLVPQDYNCHPRVRNCGSEIRFDFANIDDLVVRLPPAEAPEMAGDQANFPSFVVRLRIAATGARDLTNQSELQARYPRVPTARRSGGPGNARPLRDPLRSDPGVAGID